MKTLALYSMKGGVGKSTLAVNIAYLLAQAPQRVLLLDLDAQGASSFILNAQPSASGSVRTMLRGGKSILRSIRESDYPRLHVLPARRGLRHLDVRMEGKEEGLEPLAELLRPSYETLVIDCPPQSGAGMEAVIRLSDTLLVPIIPSPLSLRTLEMLERVLRRKASGGAKVIPIFTMVDTRKKLHSASMAVIQERYPDCAQTIIPYSADFELMGVRRAPLLVCVRKGKALEAVKALCAELRARSLA